MGIIELTLIAISLSMDAFAVSICKGLCMTKLDYKNTVIIAIFFGGFQALMPLIGWFLGIRFQVYIRSIDHFIAFGLLLIIGGKMIIEALESSDESCKECKPFSINEIFFLAIATSIDALAVGITFAFLPEVNIWSSITLIGVITFIFSGIGVIFGHKFGNRLGKKAELAGGIVLILIGTKILIEHLGLL